ncbi:hypothetical protein AJ79_09245 [Helicocarpus griseus UAMH5409]|uniref:Exosome complex protein n=1 Tax=Helicocarpus griseus UAMH5409 TaxID=1447875 RepID=A0A2B7WKZ3_9EURO|nr:hypothetical protein AJ79_09245 [Helicocarpus griseus UAMH5409]
MDTADLTPLLEQLEDNIDDLEEVFEPLLVKSLSATTQKMPVLDKAKLHVLITYALESLLFSYLRLQGVNAKEHPVWKELTRVRQYFDKLKAAEAVPEKRNMTVDKEAAGRFIKHGLAGNDKYDLERAEREAKEKAMALLKAAKLARQKASQSQSPSAPSQATQSQNTVPVEQEASSEASAESENEKGVEQSAVATLAAEKPKAKKNKKMALSKEEWEARKKLRKQRKKAKKKQIQAERKANGQSNG